jgi:hypothetical protein
MAIILSIIDIVVVLLVVINVSRAVWAGPSGQPSSLLLSLCITLAVVIFGVISLCAADGLTSNSGFHQAALLIFLLPTAAGTRLWRTNK